MTRATIIAALGAGLLASAAQAAAPGDPISFVACPIARDTGAETDLCFLAEYDGALYALTNPSDWGTPQLGHRVLVEGRIKDGPPVCGATPVDGRTSVMPELDRGCDQILPFDGSVRGTAGGVFNTGTPEQRQKALDLARRAELEPALSIEPAVAEPPAPPPPAPPYAAQTLTLYFPFESDRGSGPDMAAVMRLADYAKASKGDVDVQGAIGASRLSDGRVVSERVGMGRRRVEKIRDILVGLGVPPASISTTWQEQPKQPTGTEDWRSRSIEIRVRVD